MLLCDIEGIMRVDRLVCESQANGRAYGYRTCVLVNSLMLGPG